MPNCYIMIGLPASGKDYYIERNKEEDDVVVSSDKIREELFEDVNDQKHNGEVFNEMFKRTCAALKNGQNVYYNATNINRRRRINLIKKIKSAVKDDIYFYAIIIATPYERCLFNNSQRERKIPEEIIKRMYYHFEPPHKAEGFYRCGVVSYSYMKIHLEELLEKANKIQHNNPHHTLSIGEHMLEAENNMIRFFMFDNNSANFDDWEESILINAAKYHDIGKVETKSFKGNIAHYYNHQNVGAYLFLCSEEARDTQGGRLSVANLIYHHMDFFDEKKIEKDKAFFPEKFMVMLNLLHAVDVKAH